MKKYSLNKMYLVVTALVVAIIGAMFAVGDASAATLFDSLLVGGGLLAKYASIVPTAKSIDGDVSNVKKAGKLVKAKLWYILVDQYDDSLPFPSRVGRDIGNIPLKAGEYWHYLKTVQITNPELAIGGNMGDTGASLSNELTAIFGGIDDDLLTLIEENVGRGFYLCAEVCVNQKKHLCGDACRPMILQVPEGGLRADASSVTLKWMNESPYLFSNYVGSITAQAPDAVASDATTLAITSNDTYLIGTGSAGTGIIDVSGVTDADLNRIITVIGSGVNTIEQDAAGDFLLVGEETWTANAGAQISFKIFKQNADYKLIEVVGSRT